MLFEPTQISNLKLANRFVRSATWEGLATPDGQVTPRLVNLMGELARGGVGLIISGHAYITQAGQASPQQLGIYGDELVAGLKTMTDAVHQAGGKILAQLAHAGHFALEAVTKKTPLVASDFAGLAQTPRQELTGEDIRRLVGDYAAAARRAQKAGFDGVQIHSAHGYLLSQFLSPAFNRRRDEYGGPIENRARIHREIFLAVRAAVGSDYPVMIKINAEDFQEGGLCREDSLAVCRMLADLGLDAIELSGGLLTGGKLSPSRPGINSEEKEAYFQAAARVVKKEISCPLILVGGIRSLNVAQRLVCEGAADFISMSRPFIREPGLINRWLSGEVTPSRCRSDSLCFRPALMGQGIYCVLEEQEKNQG